AFLAMKEVGINPIMVPIRGGTDGARLSFMGLPTPNIFAGGHNFHGKYEFIPTFAMEKAVEVILKIVELYTDK
ncbi:MAG: tripeptide aminopeptidase, partial [Clostridium sp.]